MFNHFLRVQCWSRHVYYAYDYRQVLCHFCLQVSNQVGTNFGCGFKNLRKGPANSLFCILFKVKHASGLKYELLHDYTSLYCIDNRLFGHCKLRKRVNDTAWYMYPRKDPCTYNTGLIDWTKIICLSKYQVSVEIISVLVSLKIWRSIAYTICHVPIQMTS